MSLSDMESKIRQFLRTELGVWDTGISANTPLITAGVIDSAGLVRLAALLEREAGIIIPDRDITADHFDTIEKIRAYLDARRQR